MIKSLIAIAWVFGTYVGALFINPVGTLIFTMVVAATYMYFAQRQFR